jgi:hypothetical protein
MGTIHNTPDAVSERIPAELSDLCKLQFEALQKSSYVHMSHSDAEAYDRRRVRIGELYELLAKSKNDVA